MSPSKFQAWLATARIANVPSVVSNVWLGVALGAWSSGIRDSALLLKYGAVLSLSGVLLYIGGNFFNDWHDREWDAKHRPERALPQGVFQPLNYLWASLRFIGLGLVCAALAGQRPMIVAMAIAALIVIYTRWHKKAVWPVVPMGLCRGLLPVMGFFAVVDAPITADIASFIGLHAGGLFCYIMGLSLTARYESIPNPPTAHKVMARVLLFLPVPLMAASWVKAAPLHTLIGLLPFLAWTLPLLLRRHAVPVMVSGFLAGIPLVEWIASCALAFALLPAGSGMSFGEPLSINTLVLPALAFMTGRRLQAVASAT